MCTVSHLDSTVSLLSYLYFLLFKIKKQRVKKKEIIRQGGHAKTFEKIFQSKTFGGLV